MGMASPIYYTADMVRAIPDDGRRYEVVRGELLVTPAPRAWHQIVLSRLFQALSVYVDRHRLGMVLWSPADISWGQDVLVQPDLFVVPTEELRPLEWERIQHFLLVVEALSPSSTRADRFTKRAEYQRQRVPLYWIVDGEAKVVEAWTPEDRFPVVEAAQIRWHPAGVSVPFTLALADLFRPV